MNKQLTEILEYIDNECIGVEKATGRYGLNYDKAEAKLNEYIAANYVPRAGFGTKLVGTGKVAKGVPHAPPEYLVRAGINTTEGL